MKKLPIGEATFENLIRENNIYVDKTKNIYQLITEGKRYFMSRPRRFGKSLLISTLDAIFSGKKDLFKGLDILKTDYEWKEHPVLRFSFNGSEAQTPEDLEQELNYQIDKNANNQKVTLKAKKSSQKLDELIETLYKKKDKSVILVDEYDKPILKNLTETDQTKKIIDKLRAFYETMKENDKNLRFRFVTGVSKFSHTSMFSGANDLQDISMHDRFSSMLGYTQEELEKYFDEHIIELAKNQNKNRKETLSDIMNWYNGYQFSEEGEKVYNPFSTLLLFNEQKFKNYWFKSGTPTFLIDLLKEREYNLGNLEEMKRRDNIFDAFEPKSMDLEALLYQTGYLTIKKYDKEKKFYTLGYPNHEVKYSFADVIIRELTDLPRNETAEYCNNIAFAFENCDMQAVLDNVNQIYLKTHYKLFRKDEADYHWKADFIFRAALCEGVDSEAPTNRGRIDTVVDMKDKTYVIEYKPDKSGGSTAAIKQIKDKGYYEKYLGKNKQVSIVGIGIDFEKKKFSDYKLEQIKK